MHAGPMQFIQLNPMPLTAGGAPTARTTPRATSSSSDHRGAQERKCPGTHRMLAHDGFDLHEHTTPLHPNLQSYTHRVLLHRISCSTHPHTPHTLYSKAQLRYLRRSRSAFEQTRDAATPTTHRDPCLHPNLQSHTHRVLLHRISCSTHPHTPLTIYSKAQPRNSRRSRSAFEQTKGAAATVTRRDQNLRQAHQGTHTLHQPFPSHPHTH